MRLLIDSVRDGLDEEGGFRLSLEQHPSVGPCFTFNSDDGEVQVLGSQAAREVADAIYRVLGGQVARAA